MAVQASPKDLIESGAHYGHQTRRWNPKMRKYLHGAQDGVHIFDLIQTKELFDEALKELTEASKAGKKILLVGTKKQAKQKVKEVAKAAGVHYITERWLGGIVTNNGQIKKSTDKLIKMRERMQTDGYKDRTKKERLLIEREIARLERFFGGIVDMNGAPDVLFVVDIKREAVAVREAAQKNVTTIALVDSNCDPNVVTHPIPMNDDASRALEYALELVEAAIMEGKGKKSEPKKTEKKDTKAKKEDKKETKKPAKKAAKK